MHAGFWIGYATERRGGGWAGSLQYATFVDAIAPGTALD
jgi:hypothetical protein